MATTSSVFLNQIRKQGKVELSCLLYLTSIIGNAQNKETMKERFIDLAV